MKYLILTILLFIGSIVYGQRKDTVVLEDITFDKVYIYDQVGQKAPPREYNIKTYVKVLKLPTAETIVTMNGRKFQRLKNLDVRYSSDYRRTLSTYSCWMAGQAYLIYATHTTKGIFLRMGVSNSNKMTIFALDDEFEKRNL